MNKSNIVHPFSTLQGENKHIPNQLQTIFQYLKNHVATASMVTAATGVAQKSITRYKRDLQKADKLWEIRKDACMITGYKAWYITTDRNKAPIIAQSLLLSLQIDTKHTGGLENGL